MTITATEFKENLGHYLSMVKTEEVMITKNGRPVARLVSPYADQLKAFQELRGVLKEAPDMTAKEVREARLKEKCGL